MNSISHWEKDVAYSRGDAVVAFESLYRCVRGHRSANFADDFGSGCWLRLIGDAIVVADDEKRSGPVVRVDAADGRLTEWDGKSQPYVVESRGSSFAVVQPPGGKFETWFVEPAFLYASKDGKLVAEIPETGYRSPVAARVGERSYVVLPLACGVFENGGRVSVSNGDTTAHLVDAEGKTPAYSRTDDSYELVIPSRGSFVVKRRVGAVVSAYYSAERNRGLAVKSKRGIAYAATFDDSAFRKAVDLQPGEYTWFGSNLHADDLVVEIRTRDVANAFDVAFPSGGGVS